MTMTRRPLALLSLATLVSLAISADADAAGKLSGASNKRAGKPLARVLPAAAQHSTPLTIAQPVKGTAPAPHVRDAVLRLTASATAAPRVRLDSTRGTLRTFRGRVENPHGAGLVAAAAMLQDHRDVLGLSASNGAVDLVQRHVSQQPGDGLHLVLDVTWRGLPVWGAEVAAHFADDGALTSINAQNAGALTPAMVVRYGPKAAQQRARRWNAPESLDGAVTELAQPELGVWPGGHDRDVQGVLAWRLIQSLRQTDGTPQHFATYVAADSGAVLARHPMVHTEATPTTGSSTNHAGKPVTLRISHYPDKNTYGLFDQSKGLSAATLQTHDAGHTENQSTLATSPAKNTWTPAMATAHDNMQQVIDYYAETHGRNSWDGKGAEVLQLVHYGHDFNNAFWDGHNKIMAIGDGDQYFFKEFTRSLDVAGHEFSHAVVTGTVNLVYQGQPGALNESFADVMGVMIDRDDWLIGEDIVTPYVFPQGYARSFIDPPGGNQPKHMDDLFTGYEDYGGVHRNSGIPNFAVYNLASATSRELVEQVWYRTLYRNHIGSQASFVDMAEGTMTACDELVTAGKASQDDCVEVAKAWVGVGVLGSADVPMGGCPTNSSENNGICYCDPGYVPNGDGSTCVEADAVMCPMNAVQANGQCFCMDGYKPNADFSKCVAIDQGCPLDSSWDAGAKACKCDPGFEGTPNAADGKCESISSNCPAHAHPEWPDPEMQDNYLCACNENFEDDGMGGCGVTAGTCGDESFFGRCDGDTLVYCAGDEIISTDCAGDSLKCGKFDSIVGYDCLNPSGVGAGKTCAADGYQECDDSVPFCVSEEGEPDGFCSHECKAKSECEKTSEEKDAFDCCASVSDGTRACLKDPYCAENVDTKAQCNDVPGGSTYFGHCDGDVLKYCDGSTKVTQEVFCATLGKDCGWVDAKTGYSCVDPDSGALPEAPDDWCPYEADGVCDVDSMQCPEGTDLLDCNPCNGVPATGQCDGDVLSICDVDAGLVVTDCGDLEMTQACGDDGSGNNACIPGEGGGDDTADVPTEGGGNDSGDTGNSGNTDPEEDDGNGTISCTCRSDAPQGWIGLLAGLGVLLVRRRRRA